MMVVDRSCADTKLLCDCEGLNHIQRDFVVHKVLHKVVEQDSGSSRYL